ncbi:unnamed protein product [Heterobilharzia americana]|nr:unnamed protein product [Heterobilharzia americana]CAH8580210.1 unnamed protein product [Heterobilharzia americana]
MLTNSLEKNNLHQYLSQWTEKNVQILPTQSNSKRQLMKTYDNDDNEDGMNQFYPLTSSPGLQHSTTSSSSSISSPNTTHLFPVEQQSSPVDLLNHSKLNENLNNSKAVQLIN